MMPSLRLFFLATLLTALVLAAPTPGKRSLSKRSFKVPRSINPSHPRGLNGYDAMRKVYAKYGWGFIDVRKTRKSEGRQPVDSQLLAGNSTKNGSGSGTVPANPEENGALFLSPVKIGGQTLNLDFDTGSSDLWVFSTELPASAIGGHTAFDPSKSPTFKEMTGAKFSISYGDGSGAAGIVGTDVVDIGGTVVENQAVELATQVSRSFVRDTNTDGLVGLAFSKLNTVNDGTQKTPQKTFFDNVMNDLDLPLFTADLDPDGSGVYEFGKIDTSKFKGDLAWVPVNASSGFWQFESAKFAVGKKVVSNPSASMAIADTGTSLLLVDQAVADAYYAAIPTATLDATVGGFVYPCDTQLPDISVAIGADHLATIPGNLVTFAPADDTNTTCFGGVQGNGGAGLQIFGDIMFKAQFVVFNGGNQSLGYAPKSQ